MKEPENKPEAAPFTGHKTNSKTKVVLQRWPKGRPLFACSDKEVTSITPDAVERTAGGIVKRLKLGGIKVEPVPTESMLDEAIQRQAAK